MVQWYSALTGSVSLFRCEDYHQKLVKTILSFDWLCSENAMSAYGTFLLDFVCCNGRMMRKVFVTLVQRMLYHYKDKEDADEEDEDTAQEEQEANVQDEYLVSSREAVEQMHNAVHHILSKILQRIPSASTALFPVIVQEFPYRTASTERHLAFIKNLLRLSEYAPDLLERILEIIIQRLVLMDIELKPGDFELIADESHTAEDSDDENALDLMFEEHIESFEDPDTTLLGGDGLSLDHPHPHPHPHAHHRKQSAAADKVDRCIELLFQYIDLIWQRSPALCDAVFEALVRVHDSSIITTCGSRHSQFLVFYMCSFKNAYSETFVRRLMERAFDSRETIPIRIACSQYVASYLSRAKTVRHATRMHCFESMLRWIHAYIDIHEEQEALNAATTTTTKTAKTTHLDSEQHLVFFSICQSMFYVFTQLQADFITLVHESPELIEFFNFPAIVETSLNPLRYCCECVVTEFATTVMKMRAGDCYQVIRVAPSPSHPFEFTISILDIYLFPIHNTIYPCPVSTPLPTTSPSSPSLSPCPCPCPCPSPSPPSPSPSPSSSSSPSPSPSPSPSQVIRRNQMLSRPSSRSLPPAIFPFEPCRLVGCAAFLDEIYDDREPEDRVQNHADNTMNTIVSL